MSGTVLITGARAPVALEVARSFRALGWRVHLADSVPATAAGWTRPSIPVHRLPSPRRSFAAFRERLSALMRETGATLIVPTCEEVFYVTAATPPCAVFAPPLSVLRELHSKARFMALAKAAGVEVPATRLITTAAELAALDTADLVLKPEYSRFATAALIRPSAAAVRRIAPTPEHAWVAQEFVFGEELCLWASAHEGRVVAHALYRPVLRHGRSAAYAFAAIDWPPALAMAERIAAASGMTGHLSFDLIRTSDGHAVPIECNPRAVSGVHLFAGDALARAILGERRPPPPAGTRRHLAPAMALIGLPTAIARGQTRAFLRTWRTGEDAIGGPGDPWPRLGAIVDAARFAALGFGRWRSPTRQTTADIEWNGEPIT